ncbi:MAG: SixA phosphatase family protein [Rhodobacterales bacterium]
MTRTLILMRHAKSDWANPGLPDHERQLNARGAGDAPIMGAWLRTNGYLPDEALCSTAIRTRQTLAGLGFNLSTQYLPALYHAEADHMLEALQGASGTRVLMVGHNPGIAEFAAGLLQRAPDHARFADYPTSATLIAAFDIPDWSMLRYGSGHALAFVIPADLK